jgi:hypothetical protein
MAPWEWAGIELPGLSLIAIDLIGETADPIKRGSAKSAPTIKTAMPM